MEQNKPQIQEGLGTMLGKLILFLAGKGADYKDAKKFLKDPAYKKKLNDLHKKTQDLLKDFEAIKNS
jgi:hypothetical protein